MLQRIFIIVLFVISKKKRYRPRPNFQEITIFGRPWQNRHFQHRVGRKFIGSKRPMVAIDSTYERNLRHNYDTEELQGINFKFIKKDSKK